MPLGRGLSFEINALNDRGSVLVSIIEKHLKKARFHDKFVITATKGVSQVSDMTAGAGAATQTTSLAVTGIKGTIIPSEEFFREEERSKQNSIFSILREIKNIFAHEGSGQLGLYGSFGYDLTFQFEEIQRNNERSSNGDTGASGRDLILFFPDEIFVMDNQRKTSFKVKYDFTDVTGLSGSEVDPGMKLLPGYAEYSQQQDSQEVLSDSKGPRSTTNLARAASISRYVPAAKDKVFEKRDYPKGYFADSVKVAKNEFRVGNLFEVVLSQAFREELKVYPSKIFRR